MRTRTRSCDSKYSGYDNIPVLGNAADTCKTTAARAAFNDLPLTIYLDPLNPFILLRSSFGEETYRLHGTLRRREENRVHSRGSITLAFNNVVDSCLKAGL